VSQPAPVQGWSELLLALPEFLLTDARIDAHDEVAAAWIAVDLLRRMRQAPDPHTAHRRLGAFYKCAVTVVVAEITRLATTVDTWQDEILDAALAQHHLAHPPPISRSGQVVDTIRRPVEVHRQPDAPSDRRPTKVIQTRRQAEGAVPCRRTAHHHPCHTSASPPRIRTPTIRNRR
jgi:hypothetical protein